MIVLPFLTAVFFPDYGYNGVPWDLYLVHLFYFAIVIPFHVIFFAARNSHKENPNGVIAEKTTNFPNNFPSA